jgi:hypothetical protein
MCARFFTHTHTHTYIHTHSQAPTHTTLSLSLLLSLPIHTHTLQVVAVLDSLFAYEVEARVQALPRDQRCVHESRCARCYCGLSGYVVLVVVGVRLDRLAS